MSKSSPLPQGIGDTHIRSKSWYRYANPAAVAGIGLFLAAALAGVFGGQPHPTRVIETPSATITLQFPERLRNGEFFEMRIAGIARMRDVAWAILEPQGKISFIRKDEKTDGSRADQAGERPV